MFSGKMNCFIADNDEGDAPLELLTDQISVFRKQKKTRQPKITKKRQEMIELLKSGVKTAKKIAEKVGRTAHAITQMLCAMFKARQITKVKHSVYDVLSEEQLAMAF
jgi:predicted transcriptional regulator